MANFFLDNKDLQFHMNHPLMKKIVELKEKNMPTRTRTTTRLSISRTLRTATAA